MTARVSVLVIGGNNWPSASALYESGLAQVIVSDAVDEGGAAYNRAAARADLPLLLTLRHSDRLTPEYLDCWLTAWMARSAGVAAVYPAIYYESGQDFGRHIQAAAYNLSRLLREPYLPAGLHEKATWEAVRGFPEGQAGPAVEWGYWLTMARAGFCGRSFAVPDTLYMDYQRGWRGLTDQASYARHRLSLADLYAGRLPVGCCGAEDSPAATQPQPTQTSVARPAQLAVGTNGLVVVRYVGANVGNMTWWGAFTRQQYVFGGGRLQGYVDMRDADGFLSIHEGGRPVFEVART